MHLFKTNRQTLFALLRHFSLVS